MNYPRPDNELERLEALHAYHLLDTPPEEPFERLVQVARRVLDVPVAGFCLLDESRQWFKAVDGGDARQTPREFAFCNHAITTGEPLVVSDARRDPRFKDNPLVTQEVGVRAYAGMPIRAYNGSYIGTLIVLDWTARRFTQQECAHLKMLAERLEEHLELRRLAMQVEGHRQNGAIADDRAGELQELWEASSRMMLEELAGLERSAAEANWRVDPEQRMTFEDAVASVAASFDMAKQMAINFRNLGETRSGFDLMPETFCPSALVGTVREKFDHRFEAQNRTLSVEDRTDGFELRADLGVLRRVLENLIDNGVSYSPVGTDIHVEFQSDGDWLTVRVHDRGPGPSKQLGDRVFDEGVSRDTLIDSGAPGPRRGDGLSYVRAAVDAHGGIVGYEHGDPTGCIFWFCVPSNPRGLPVER
ncbi:MAG: GAF domain-containing sensor histidine kinase [Myxococcota bacterium]